jgi:molybdate transport system substrate-binding protein
MQKLLRTTVLAVLTLVVSPLAHSQAAEIKCICAEAMRPALTELGPQFERATGHKLIVTYELAPVVTRKIEQGEPFDLAVLNPPQAADLIKQGKFAAGTSANLARAGLGVAVRAGTPKPDISSVEAFKRVMLEAKSVTFPEEGTSGAYFRRVLERLGISEQMQPKLRPSRARGASFGMVASGEAEMMITVIPQFLVNPGIEVAGPLPAELQTWIELAAAIGADAKQPQAADELIKYLKTPAAVALFKAKGWEPMP